MTERRNDSGKSILVGMVGLQPLPGTYHHSGQSVREIEKHAVAEAIKLKDAGFDGIMIQNVNDIPSKRAAGPEVISCMAAIGRAVREAVGPIYPIGVSVLKNEGAGAVAVAHAIEADFVRLKVYVGAMLSAEGITEGCVEEVLEMWKRIRSSVQLWADVYDRTGVPLAPMTLEEAAEMAVSKGRADRLIITGRSISESIEWIRRVKENGPSSFVYLGGGATPDNLGKVMQYADGVIVGSWLKKDGVISNEIDDRRLADFMKAYRSL